MNSLRGAIKVKAAVLHEIDGPFVLEDLMLEAPRTGEVIVRIVATGMCHTDAVIRSGGLPMAVPVVLGHEGAGIVEAVGPGVGKVVPGDHVVITIHSCGLCEPCLSGRPSVCNLCFPLNFGGSRPDGSHALTRDGHGISDQFFGQSSFATVALAHERNVVKVTKEVPLELLGPLACGIQTGAGSVIKGLRVGFGETFVVFGSGAVGLSAVMAARACGAGTIIAVDLVPSRLTLARELGATHTLDARGGDAVARVMAICGGVHYALDTTGSVRVIRDAIEALRPGGVCAILGASAGDAELSFPVVPFMSMSKSVRGIIEGDVVPDIFIPQMIDLYRQGRFPFDKLVKFYELTEINQALEDSERGTTVKPIIRMPV